MGTKKRMHNVFVYGTLRPTGEAATHHLSDHAMFSAGKFPYIMPSPGNDDDEVLGNIIEVTGKQLLQLDKYENVQSGLYVRKKEDVYPIGMYEDGVEVWVYVAGPALTPTPITSGDWFNQ